MYTIGPIDYDPPVIAGSKYQEGHGKKIQEQ